MRMRKRANLEPRMARCAALLETDARLRRGHWLEDYPALRELQVELGCGKGRFTADTAERETQALLVAIERVPDAMILAMERAQARGLTNIRFLDADAQALTEFFAPGEVSRLYINFCDPWPKSRDAKLRLTAPGFLRQYAEVLAPGGQIWLKTDNGPLFDWSREQFAAEGWALSELTDDLHGAGPVGVLTDYEAKFLAESLAIHRLVATRTDETKTTAAGPVPRLRGASLVDARGYARSAADQQASALSDYDR